MYPKLRFKGFDDAWEQRKLSDIGNIITGSTPSTKDKNNYNGDFLFVSPADIQGNRFVEKTITTLSELGFKKGRILAPKSTLFVSIGSTIGKVAQIRDFAVTNQQINSIEPFKDIDPDFVFSLMQKESPSIRCLSATQAVPILNKTTFSNVEVSIASNINEQYRIGELFIKLDSTITLHQRQCEALKKQKQFFLQNMFPKEGESVPRIRFNGFTEPWEQRKLGDLAEIVGGGTPSTSKDEYWDGEIDWYAPAEIANQIYVESSERKITSEGLNNSSAKMLPVGTVLFTSRAGIGKMAILRKEACTNQGFQSIVPHVNELDSYFIFSRSEELKRYGETVGAGSTFVEVSGKQMSAMPLMMPPTIDEQRKIGEYFSSLDNLITLHQRQYEQLVSLKKYLLSKMFI